MLGAITRDTMVLPTFKDIVIRLADNEISRNFGKSLYTASKTSSCAEKIRRNIVRG